MPGFFRRSSVSVVVGSGWCDASSLLWCEFLFSELQKRNISVVPAPPARRGAALLCLGTGALLASPFPGAGAACSLRSGSALPRLARCRHPARPALPHAACSPLIPRVIFGAIHSPHTRAAGSMRCWLKTTALYNAKAAVEFIWEHEPSHEPSL